MPTFQIETGGSQYEIDAPSQDVAIAGLQDHINNTAITPDALVRQAARGIPVVGGAVNKFAAMMDAATQPVLGRGSSAPTYEQRYAENYPQQEGRDVAFEQANPVTATAAQLVGGVGSVAPIGAGTELGQIALGMKGTSLGSRTLASGLSGAGISAADAASRGQDVGPAALIGGGIGAAIPGVAAGIGAGMRGIRGALAPAPTASLPGNLMRIGGQDLPLTAGELTGDAATQAFERGAARGQEGTPAQTIAQPFYENRLGQVNQATQQIQASMSPTGTVQAETPAAAGSIIGPALGATQNTAKQGVDALYNAVRANPTVIPADNFAYLARRVKADLDTGANRVVVNENTPAASKMLDYLDRWRGVPVNKADFMGMATGGPTGSTMADIDQVRQQLLTLKANASTQTDSRAGGRIIGAFDRQIDQIAPSPQLAAARAAHSDYRSTFFQQTPADTIGRDVQKIVGSRPGAQPATPTEVADLLYGSPKGNSPRLVERLGTIFGSTSPEFSAVKQGYLSRIMESPQGTPWESAMLAKRLTDALTGNGAELTAKIFTQPEKMELQQLRNYLLKITPKPGTVNYSGTAAPILKRLAGMLPKGLALGGLALHGIPGAIVGAGLGRAEKALGERLATRRVARSLYGTPPVAPLSPAAAAAIRSIQLLPPVLAPQLSQPVAPPVNQ